MKIVTEILCLTFCLISFNRNIYSQAGVSGGFRTLVVDQHFDDPNMKGTLRWAINEVNNSNKYNRIEFSINQEIVLDPTYGALPTLSCPVTIDGTYPGFNPGTDPFITINGQGLIDYCFLVARGQCDYSGYFTIKGILIKGFRLYGIRILEDSTQILYNTITEINDPILRQNSEPTGIIIEANSCKILENAIGRSFDLTSLNFNNMGIGIHISGGIGNVIEKNIIWFSGKTGIKIESTDFSNCNGYSNLISENIIRDNSELAIDIHFLQSPPRYCISGNRSKMHPCITSLHGTSNNYTLSGWAPSKDKIEIFTGTEDRKKASSFVGSTITDICCDQNGDTIRNLWRIENIPSHFGTNYVATATHVRSQNTSELYAYCWRLSGDGLSHMPSLLIKSDTVCINQPISFPLEVGVPGVTVDEYINASKTYEFLWKFGDGGTSGIKSPQHSYSSKGKYRLTLLTKVQGYSQYISALNKDNLLLSFAEIVVEECEPQCIRFGPSPGKYIISVWVKESNGMEAITYENPQVLIEFTDSSGSVANVGPFIAKGDIIDGWQLISEEFTIPLNGVELNIKLQNKSSRKQVYFDDIRLHPFDANMKSFVYDPVNLRFVAELDENNYATFYEYDEDGALIRIKKETERGIMTIQESRNSIKKKGY